MSTLPKDLREAAHSYELRGLYESEWRRPAELLRSAATALELAEVDRSCLQAALRAANELLSKQAQPGEEPK